MGFIASIKKKINSQTKIKTLKFHTTLQCGGCVQKVKPHLDKISAIQHWEVKLDNVNKLLVAKVEAIHANEVENEVIKALEKEGYSARLVN